MRNLVILSVLLKLIIGVECDNFDVLIDAKATQQHRVDSLNLLIYCEFFKFLELFRRPQSLCKRKNPKINRNCFNIFTIFRYAVSVDSPYDMDIQIPQGIMAARDWISCNLW